MTTFQKFLKSYPVKENNAQNALFCIKDFCNFVGFPNIIISDNGSEYKNHIIKEYCDNNKILQIFSSPRHPRTNGVIEIAHKETRRFILNDVSENINEIDLPNILLDANHTHNYNTHTVTKYRPIDLINNTDNDIYEEVINNIRRKYQSKTNEFKILEKGTKIKLKPGCYKIGRNIKFRKMEIKLLLFQQQ